MEQNHIDPIAVALTKWKELSRGKKILLGLVPVGGIGLLIIYWGIVNLMATSTGLQSDGIAPMIPAYDQARLGAPVPTGVAREGLYYDDGYVAGNDAEAFETRDYTARIESRDLVSACGALDALKPQTNVIFLSASQSDTNCYYQFKVANATVPAVLETIKALDPKELTEQTNSIKAQLENSLNQRTILTDNLAATEAILADALVAYDTLLTTAVNAQDSASLAQAVRDKIALIDQLKQRRDSTRQQIDALNRQLAEQQDRLLYTYFTVSVQEIRYVDMEDLTSSWQYAIKRMVSNANEVFQALTVGLITFILHVILYAVYIVIILIIAKLGWRIVRAVWRG